MAFGSNNNVKIFLNAFSIETSVKQFIFTKMVSAY